MKDKFNDKDTCSNYSFNDAMILDKIQEILDGQNIDELDLSEDSINELMSKLSESISSEDINDSAYILAKNIDELEVLPTEDVNDYILRVKNYLNTTTFKFIKAEFKGVEFDVSKDDSVDDIFKDYYFKYDEMYEISEMLYDLGLK